MANITIANADAYFGPLAHVRSSVWLQFSLDLRKAALAQARRILARALNRAINDAEVAYVDGDSVREEYAVYEQALWIAENSAIVANGDHSAPREIATDPESEDKARDTQHALLAPEAIRWLTGGSPARVVLISG